MVIRLLARSEVSATTLARSQDGLTGRSGAWGIRRRASWAWATMLVLVGFGGGRLGAQEAPPVGFWDLPGTNLWMKVGGYVKADIIYDVDGTRDPDQFLMSTIPVEGDPDYRSGGYLHFIAKETRFNFDVRRVAGDGMPIRVFFEGDFWSAGNQFRLRHAYVEAGEFMMGQNWTTLSTLSILPFFIDFAAGDALFGGRSAQVRWTRQVNEGWKVAVGLEELVFKGIDNPAGLPGQARLGLPLLAVRADYSWDTGTLILGSSAAELRWTAAGVAEATALQLAGLVAFQQRLASRTTFMAHVSGGVGAGENVIAFAGSRANAVLLPDGTLDTMPVLAFFTGLTQGLSDELTSTLFFAYGWLDAPPSREPDLLMNGGIGHVNLVWRPIPEFATGLEYIWGAQRVTSEAFGRASRFQAMTAFYF